jgi:hypothetical protein
VRKLAIVALIVVSVCALASTASAGFIGPQPTNQSLSIKVK